MFLGRTDEAIKCFEMVTLMDPENYEAFLLMGIMLLELEKYKEALESFENVLKLKPDNEDALIKKGQSLGFLEEPEEALNVSTKL